jgi:cytochrome oxidase Cu insertion factor (SCO1/SenC/PrrC family)
MSGMNSGLNPNDPVVVAAFRSALLHQGAIALLIFVLLSLVWASVREWLPAQAGAQGTAASVAAGWAGEPVGRRVLRIGFGLLWLFDGLLQAQPAMAVGLPSQVIQPAAASSPPWVQQVVNWGGTTWSYHPIQAGAAAVWIQVGVGIWLLAAADGPWSRLAGLTSVGWGLVVWVWGEAFGGIFAPGLTWLFGAPGAVLFYCAAGGLIALPDRHWLTPRLGRAVLASLGVFFAGMAVLQAWPGRGFWQGVSHGQQGTLAGMTSDMAQTPQPGMLAAWVRAFTAFDEAHGFAVNLFVVIALAAVGAALVAARPRLLRPALAFLTVLCLADWVLIEDFGFFGGLGTDPNSMLPMLLLVIGGYLALVQPAAPAAAPAHDAVPADAGTAVSGGWRDRFGPGALRQRIAAASVRSVVSLGAVGVIALGAAPMAAAQASASADPILAQSIGGASAPLDYPAPPFALTDQHGRAVSLASLRGKVVLLTFLDPVCTSDCPLIAQEMRYASQLLGAGNRQVELVAITLSPTYRSLPVINAFDRQERLASLPNWLFLTGSLSQLKQIWHAYGMTAYDLPAGAMSAHNDQAYVIDRAGHIRTELSTDPGPGSSATKASFASLLAGAARKVLASS